MIESDQETGRRTGPAALTVVWLVLLADAGLNALLARVDLGVAQLPVALALASVNLALIGWWFMHLREQAGARRMALPAGILYLLLLLALVLLDVATRFLPARPGGVPWHGTVPPVAPEPPGGELPRRPGP